MADGQRAVFVGVADLSLRHEQVARRLAHHLEHGGVRDAAADDLLFNHALAQLSPVLRLDAAGEAERERNRAGWPDLHDADPILNPARI